MSIHCKSCRRDLAPSNYEEGYKTCNSCRVKSKGKSKKLNIAVCKKFAEEKGGLCLSEKYVNAHSKMMWKCAENHEWSAVYNNIKRGYWCPECGGSKKLTIDECKKYAEEKGGECLTEEYVNSKTKMLWKCAENHQWEAIYNNIKSGYWCPHCSSSRSEKLCREILEQHFNEQFPNVRPSFLNGLELDGYNEKLNLAFEYNGEQHYKYVPHFHRSGEDEFKQQLERDRKKYRMCAEMGIKLIIIPYKFNCYNPEKLKIFILDALASLMNSKIEHKVVTV